MIGISSSCFGTRYSKASEQVETARKLDFDQIEFGWSDSPPQWDGVEEALQKFGVKAPSLRAGCRETARGNYKACEGLSSLNEETNQQALQSILADVALAKRTRSRLIVLSAGYIAVPGIAERIRTLLAQLRQGNEKESLELQKEIQLAVTPHRLKHLDRLCRSLYELARREPTLNWAIETPKDPHFLPNPLELEHIFEDLPNLNLSYFHDVGRAAFLEKLEKIPHGQWLEKFVSKLAGLHLHDLIGLDQHQPPGLGEIDWTLVSGYVPRNALRVLEVDPQNNTEALRGAVRFLEKFGF